MNTIDKAKKVSKLYKKLIKLEHKQLEIENTVFHTMSNCWDKWDDLEAKRDKVILKLGGMLK